jgi:hypothetical protein
MIATEEIYVLGAEAQAACSLALAFPERRFVFVSDCAVIDSWDLPNVRMLHGEPQQAASFAAQGNVIPLSARWRPDPEATGLSRLFPLLEERLPGAVLPLVARPGDTGQTIAKGNLWHRPDHPPSGSARQLADLEDPHGCGLVYQKMIATEGTVMAIGRRAGSGAVALGLFRVLVERFFRIDLIQATESVAIPDLVRRSREVLAALSWDGWFTMNWVLGQAGPRLSSFRPVPKSVFRCFREAGIDLLARRLEDALLPEGLRMVAQPHYAEFQWL